MVTPAEPIDLPALVVLLYRADWTRLCLSATVHARHDGQLRARMYQVQAKKQHDRRMLGYKTAWAGGTLVLAGRFYPSTKTCSGCGTVKTKLALSERTYTCQRCGLTLDRDVNAAANLLTLAASGAESHNASRGTVRPGPAGHVPVKEEPGTATADQTGTASGQPLAAGQELTHAH